MSPLLAPFLKEHLARELSSLALIGQCEQSDAARPPQVFIGDLPAKRRERDAREIPCVVIVPFSGFQQEGSCVTEVALICAVYNREEGDGEGLEGDMALLLNAVSRALMPCANGIPLGRRFNLCPDNKGRLLPWSKDEKQLQPFLQATMTSTWTCKGWE